MDYKRTLEIAGIIVGLVGAGAAGSWALYSNDLQFYKEKVASLEKSNKLNYPAFLEKIESASTTFQSRLDKLDDFEQLKETTKSLKIKNAELAAEIKDLNSNHKKTQTELSEQIVSQKSAYESRISILESEIEEFRADVTPFELLAGSGVSLKGGLVQVGFTESDSSYVCKISVNNKKYSLEAGLTVDVAVAEESCKVVLNKCPRLSYDPAKFELVCT